MSIIVYLIYLEALEYLEKCERYEKMFQTTVTSRRVWHIVLLSVSLFDEPVTSLVISNSTSQFKVCILNNAKNISQRRKRLNLICKNDKWNKKWRYLFNLILECYLKIKLTKALSPCSFHLLDFFTRVIRVLLDI